jgi:outer membrane biosynthesis protein TonB
MAASEGGKEPRELYEKFEITLTIQIMWRQLFLVLAIFVAASSATKGGQRTSPGVRRSLQEVTDPASSPPIVPPEPLDKGDKKQEKDEKDEKEKKEKKNKKCKAKEKASKAPSTTPPPPPPEPKPQIVETESNLVGRGSFGSDTNSTSAASDEDVTIVGGNALVRSAENTTEADLPYCTDEENPEGLATKGSNLGKVPIAASALGLIMILLGYMGWKRFQNRKALQNDKVCVPNLY